MAFYQQILGLAGFLLAAVILVAFMPRRNEILKGLGWLMGRLWSPFATAPSKSGYSSEPTLTDRLVAPEEAPIQAPPPSVASPEAAAPTASVHGSSSPLPRVFTSLPPTAFLEALTHSKLFVARVQESDRPEVLRALEYLLQRSNQAPAPAFAEAMGIPLYRVAGWVSAKLGERLNLDGYLVVRVDAATDQVVLQPAVLEQVFEVKL